jgi:hypothetical protein
MGRIAGHRRDRGTRGYESPMRATTARMVHPELLVTIGALRLRFAPQGDIIKRGDILRGVANGGTVYRVNLGLPFAHKRNASARFICDFALLCCILVNRGFIKGASRDGKYRSCSP